MKESLIIFGLIFSPCIILFAQQKAIVREYNKTFKTYSFSDPDPIPRINPLPKMGKIYPYFRFDGYTNIAVQKEWKIVELENDYIKVMILPEIGGKIWSAIEKSTGIPFIYYNHVVKFRDIALRGAWTSGGIESNYGIIGHSPNCSTPVDYTIEKRSDGSVSCIIGALDLFTRTYWRIDINLPKDKAYFTTHSFWYNSSPIEQPYYTWMNAGIKAKGNLQFIFPGTKYIGHEGEYKNWPFDEENGKDLSYYENNDFGGSKSYHVFGKYTDFFGGYWHNDDLGVGRFSTHDDKVGKKIWIWGLSQQGMIWEKLLTDTDGQYVEIQSGRLFNQARKQSSFTPFKNKGFIPKATDTWSEYWFPIVKTKGAIAANNYGILNFRKDNGWLKIYFSPLQPINDELKIVYGNKIIYSKILNIVTLQLFIDSISFNGAEDRLAIILGKKKLEYDPSKSANVLSRPVKTPSDFDWDSMYGLYLQGKEDIHQRLYASAEKKLKSCLKKNPNYSPALVDLSMLLYQRMDYNGALNLIKKSLSIDTYDQASNYYYGLINMKLGNLADAKDGFDVASLGIEYRSASYVMLSSLYLKQLNFQKSIDYARKSLDFNRYSVDAYQLLAVNYRLQRNKHEADKVLNSLLLYDPLNHIARFEKYLWQSSDENKEHFIDLIRNEMPQETFLELAIWYYNIGRNEEASKVLQLSPSNAEISYWEAFLENKPLNNTQLNFQLVFPFRPETAEILEQLIPKNNFWLLKYHLALIHWNCNNLGRAKDLFLQCGSQPDYGPFYAARAELFMKNDSSNNPIIDLQYAIKIDKTQWRYGKSLIIYYLSETQFDKALITAKQYQNQFPNNYVIGMLYAKTLLLNKQYKAASNILKTIQVLPNEGATEGRKLFKEAYLMLALDEMEKGNYKKALSYISTARQWPENLGVGKPYDNDIDERLENWLSCENYVKIGNGVAAKQMLDKILLFKLQKDDPNISPINNLVTAWAMQKVNEQKQAEIFLENWINEEPDNVLAHWVLNTFKGKYSILTDETVKDENYRVLEDLINIKAKS